MNNSFETYSQMLAKEHISLAYDTEAITASFDIKKRTITLPVINFLGTNETQLLTAHEVGHALFSKYSPEEFKELIKEFGSLLNVIEDIYIESSIKREYPGLVNTFREAYKSFYKNNFFKIDGIDPNSLHFFDRINLFFKIGHCVPIKFSQEESEYIVKCYNLKSNDDVIHLCRELKKFDEEQKEKGEDNSKGESEELSGQSETESQGSFDDDGEDLSLSKEEDAEDSEEQKSSTSTYDNFEKSLGRAIQENNEKREKEYKDLSQSFFYTLDVTINTANNPLENLTIDITKQINDNYSIIKKFIDTNNVLKSTKEAIESDLNNFKRISKDGDIYFQTLKNAKRMRNVKRKQTGNIDFTRLASYKTSENIFKIKQLKDKEQSHAVTIMVDYSGSMYGIINQTLIQALLICEFCKRNKIWFDFYLFGYLNSERDDYDTAINIAKVADPTSYNPDAIYTLLSTYYYTEIARELHYSLSKEHQDLRRSGLHTFGNTPLITASLAIWHILNKQKQMGYDKTHCILISDGDYSSYSPFNCTINSYEKALQNNFNGSEKNEVLMNYTFSKNDNSTIIVNGQFYKAKGYTMIANNVISSILLNAKERFGTNFTFSFLKEKNKFGAHALLVKEFICNGIDIDATFDSGITIKKPDEGSFADSLVLCVHSNSNDLKEKFKRDNLTTPSKVKKYLKNKGENDKILSAFIKELAQNIA